jgi:hypothetical protein
MEKNGFVVYPSAYRTRLGFMHDFCKGCVYENGSFRNEEKRIRECLACIDVQDSYYENNYPINITKNEDGKNIARSLD